MVRELRAEVLLVCKNLDLIDLWSCPAYDTCDFCYADNFIFDGWSHAVHSLRSVGRRKPYDLALSDTC